MTTLIMSALRPQQIADGVKTMTCRPVREGDMFRQEALGMPAAAIGGKGVLKWKVGGVYGIKPARTAPVCIVDKYGEVVRVIDAAKVAGASPIGLQVDSLEN